jgi:hypothetical protein
MERIIAKVRGSYTAIEDDNDNSDDNDDDDDEDEDGNGGTSPRESDNDDDDDEHQDGLASPRDSDDDEDEDKDQVCLRTESDDDEDQDRVGPPDPDEDSEHDNNQDKDLLDTSPVHNEILSTITDSFVSIEDNIAESDGTIASFRLINPLNEHEIPSPVSQYF